MGSPRPRSVRSGAHVLYQHRLPQPRRPTSSGTTALYRSRYCCRMHIASLYMTNYQTNPSFTKILKLYNQIYDKYALYPLITKLQPITSLYDQYITKNNLHCGDLCMCTVPPHNASQYNQPYDKQQPT